MEITKAAAGILAAVCVTAGAGGAYLLTRGDNQPATQTAEHVAPDAALGSAAPVEQSEAVVSEPAVSTAPAVAAPVERERPAPRRESSSARAATPSRQARTSERAANTGESANTGEPAYTPRPPVQEAPVLTAPVEPIPAAQPEPIVPAMPPAPQFEDLIVSADSVIGLQVESSVTSERARVEDEVLARVTRDVKVGERVAIPAGAQAIGEVTLVDRGGKMRDTARLGIRFTSIVLADGTRVPIETETIIREGSSPGGESAAKIGGGAIGGAIIGGILGGAKGAVIGGSAGAGAGTAAVLAGGRNAATLTSGAPITVRLLKPATVTVEK